MDAKFEKGNFKYGRNTQIQTVTGYQMTTQKFYEIEAPYYSCLLYTSNFNLIQYFNIIVGATLDGTLSEKKDVISAVLKQLPDAKKPVMVGDRRQDVIGAKLCGLPCIGVRFGYAEKNELEDAGAYKDVYKRQLPALMKKSIQRL